ncbi:hypothetical protein ACFE04_007490 [Oxalis oulophora]
MVIASTSPIRSEKILTVDNNLPVIDLSRVDDRSELSKVIIKACEEYGFFKVINHGVSDDVVTRMEQQGLDFFGMPLKDKLLQKKPQNINININNNINPLFGYGRKNIGFNGDMGEVEYLLLNTNHLSIIQTSKSISAINHPSKFSSAVIDYIQAVREVACELLDLMAEGLWVPNTSALSTLIRDVDNDSVFRLNHYPPFIKDTSSGMSKIGFGEHTDPQILTILRSNDVAGLQISLGTDVWVPVSPDPTAFCVFVGDLLQPSVFKFSAFLYRNRNRDPTRPAQFLPKKNQTGLLHFTSAMTNGRFISVRHRALTYSSKSRMSMAYFAAPPLHSLIAPVSETLLRSPLAYKPFTWAEYKKAAYSLRLGDSRLDLFRLKGTFCKQSFPSVCDSRKCFDLVGGFVLVKGNFGLQSFPLDFDARKWFELVGIRVARLNFFGFLSSAHLFHQLFDMNMKKNYDDNTT